MKTEVMCYSMFVTYVGSFEDYSKYDFKEMALEIIENKGIDKERACLDETIRVDSEDAEDFADYIKVDDRDNHECLVIWRELGRTFTDEDLYEEAKWEAADAWYDSRSDRE